MGENWQLPDGYSIKEGENSISLFKGGILVFHSFQKVNQEGIKETIAQIEEAQKLIGATKKQE